MYEPYRIKVVEPIVTLPRRSRSRALREAHYNPFHIPADHVAIDLISDSGTGAMSSTQWAAMIAAREDFSGQRSYQEFTRIARRTLGLPYVQPVHQGRSAESMLFPCIVKQGSLSVSNTHFETTRATIEALGGKAIDLPTHEQPYCGNIDMTALEKLIRRSRKIRMVILTITNNINGGQPVSLSNIRDVHRLTRKNGVLLVFDASRFAGNLYLVKKYSKLRRSFASLCRQVFSYCDIAYMSSKKDGLVNIGGLIALRDKRLFEKLQFMVIKQESYPTAGGLAARDLAALTLGLQETMNEELQRAHIENIYFLASMLQLHDVRIFEPVGAHGIVILPRKKQRYAGFSLAAEIYLASGVRGGIFGENLRLALPRRVYTRNHLLYVAEAIGQVYHRKIMKLKCVYRPKDFFNFFARFKRIK